MRNCPHSSQGDSDGWLGKESMAPGSPRPEQLGRGGLEGDTPNFSHFFLIFLREEIHKLQRNPKAMNVIFSGSIDGPCAEGKGNVPLAVSKATLDRAWSSLG